MPRGGKRSLLDDDSLLGSSDRPYGADELERSHFSISDPQDSSTSSSHRFFAGPISTVKDWWADDRKRKILLGSVCAAVTLLLIIVIAVAVANKGHSGDDGPTPPPPSPPESPTPWLNRRLPSTAFPTSYALMTNIDLESDTPTFWGTVNITLRVTQPIDHLLLHAHSSLTTSDVWMTGEDGGMVDIAAVWRYPANQYLVLNFTRTLQPQTTATLSLSFHANLSGNPLSGLYLAYYTNSTGQRVNMATTQFEAVGARRAFPCFDEPAFKAEFVLAIHASSRYPTVLSNMPSANSTASPVRSGWVVTRFQPTVVMSTYLVAIVVCDFVYTERQSQCGGSRMIPSRVYAPAHRLNATVIPARIAADIISHYCTYFDIEYPLPKEDHIYIPQFSGAHTTHTHNTAHTAHTRRDSAATVPTCDMAPTPRTITLPIHRHHCISPAAHSTPSLHCFSPALYYHTPPLSLCNRHSPVLLVWLCVSLPLFLFLFLVVVLFC